MRSLAFCFVAAVALALGSCGSIPKVTEARSGRIEIDAPTATRLPTVALLHVTRPQPSLEPLYGPWSQSVAVENGLTVWDDRIVLDPRSNPVAVPVLGDWENVTLYAPGRRVKALDARALRNSGVLSVAWPEPERPEDRQLVRHAEEPLDANTASGTCPFRIDVRGGAYHLAAKPGWTTSFPGGDLPDHLRIAPGRWDRALLAVPRERKPVLSWAGEDRCDLILTRPAADGNTQVASLLAVKVDLARGTVAWIWMHYDVPPDDPDLRTRLPPLDGYCRVVDLTR